MGVDSFHTIPLIFLVVWMNKASKSSRHPSLYLLYPYFPLSLPPSPSPSIYLSISLSLFLVSRTFELLLGKGAVYSYDPVGSFEREEHRAGGSAAALIQPFLDNQVGFKNQHGQKQPLSLAAAISLAKDAFTSATERDIHTGDCLEIWVITKEGVQLEKYPLKKD